MSKPRLLHRADLRCPNCKSAPEVIRLSDDNFDDFLWEDEGVLYPVLIRHTEATSRLCLHRIEVYHLTLPLAIGNWKESLKKWKI